MLVVEDELRSLNPATLDVVGSVRTTDHAALEEIVARAREAQARWAETSLDERRRLVLDAARVLLDRMDEVAALVTAETGKPLSPTPFRSATAFDRPIVARLPLSR